MRNAINTLILVFFILAATALYAHAEDKYWFGGDGELGDPANWVPYGMPTSLDFVFLTNEPGINATAYVDSGLFGEEIRIYGTGAQTMNLLQSGGSFFAGANSFVVESGGTYTMTDGSFITEQSITIDGGVFNQSGGQAEHWDPLDIRNGGVYNLSGTGQLRGTHFGEGIWDGKFNQSGGHYWAFGSIPDVKGLYIGEKGIYNLSGGTLHYDGIINHGIINFSGGEMVPNGIYEELALTNNGSTNLSSEGTRTIDGYIVNSGTFKTTLTTADYTGTFTNNGAYISDTSTQFFNYLTVSETGYLVGQHSDEFYIYGDIVNHSAKNYEWNTKQAYLGFLDGEDNQHDFYLTGQDFGAKRSGYANNFSWGTLDLTDDVLTLYDGNDDLGAALYLGEILGIEILGEQIINIFSDDDLNIYYRANLVGNEYLGGKIYALSGAGQLIPIFITIQDIIDFFDESIADATLEGVGKNPKIANFRLWLLGQMLKAANYFIEKDKMKVACFIENRSYKRCDDEPRPKDFVQGESVPGLADMIMELMCVQKCRGCVQ